MQTKKLAFLTACLLSAAMLWGCGSNGSGGSAVQPVDVADVQTVGIFNCSTCHGTGLQAQEWLSSMHAAGSYGGSTSACLACHDPTGDGQLMAVSFAGEVNRNVVGCEACHGGGSAHRGIGPLPYPVPSVEQCLQCHASIDPVTGEYIPVASNRPHNPSAASVGVDYLESGHATGTIRTTNGCVRCHTHEGARTYQNLMTSADISANALAIPDAGAIECTTCHLPHSLDLLRSATLDLSAQYNTCNYCHGGNDKTLIWQGGANHLTNLSRTIIDTHYNNPFVDPALNNAGIQGYGMRKNSDTVCSDCHNIHSGDLTINLQWARSGHGGNILDVKDAAVADAALQDPPLTGVARTDFVSEAAVTSPSFVRAAGWNAACQRCHTATGASNFLNSPAAYNPANNDFSHTGGNNNELLYCWACHDDAGTGSLRNPGAITETYTETTAGNPPVTIVYPDINGSNVCMGCHLGREIGENIKVDLDADGVRGFINSHYLAAGAQLFAVSGYEYNGRNYQNVSFYVHDVIGTDVAPGTGDNGPCIGCHMTTPENGHGFLPVTKNELGEITAITSTVCIECHTGGFALTPEILTNEEHEYFASLEVLKAALADVGIFFREQHPYFFTAAVGGDAFTDWESIYPGLPTTDANWKNTMGSAFNLNLLLHDPGGYAHNRFYVKALIWDSIDWIDDGILNDSVVATIQSLETAELITVEDSAAAQIYLGTGRPGDAQRPPLP